MIVYRSVVRLSQSWTKMGLIKGHLCMTPRGGYLLMLCCCCYYPSRIATTYIINTCDGLHQSSRSPGVIWLGLIQFLYKESFGLLPPSVIYKHTTTTIASSHSTDKPPPTTMTFIGYYYYYYYYRSLSVALTHSPSVIQGWVRKACRGVAVVVVIVM